ncbi:hypothetical protein AA0313_2765 [Acetobacter indonesiensis NRIC 0313]|nr:hypothetical protein AA0313_2765 [Acetobacter indonesiensis NRIC 0313]
MLDHMLPDDIAKGIGIPVPAPQKRLLPPWTRISCSFRSHPSRLAWFIANQNVKEGARRSRNTLLPKQRRDPLLGGPKPGRPQIQRLFN